MISESQTDAVESNISLRGKILGNWQLFHPFTLLFHGKRNVLFENYISGITSWRLCNFQSYKYYDHRAETLAVLAGEPQIWYRVKKLASRFSASVGQHEIFFCKFCQCGEDFWRVLGLLKPTWKYETKSKSFQAEMNRIWKEAIDLLPPLARKPQVSTNLPSCLADLNVVLLLLMPRVV